MEVLDCFTFNDELEVIDIRFHTLDKYISKFIIVESNKTHQGNKKKINFNIKYFRKFEKKIKYLLLDDTLLLDKNKNDLFHWLGLTFLPCFSFAEFPLSDEFNSKWFKVVRK